MMQSMVDNNYLSHLWGWQILQIRVTRLGLLIDSVSKFSHTQRFELSYNGVKIWGHRSLLVVWPFEYNINIIFDLIDMNLINH